MAALFAVSHSLGIGRKCNLFVLLVFYIYIDVLSMFCIFNRHISRRNNLQAGRRYTEHRLRCEFVRSGRGWLQQLQPQLLHESGCRSAICQGIF